MSFYQNGILISGVNTLPELTRAQYEALPADKRPEYWVCLDEEYEPSSSGHEIENSAGTKLTQRDVMQVTDGLEAVDDSTNQKTKIKMNLPIVSSADWNAMTEQEKTAYKASHYRFGVEVPDTEGVINAEYMTKLWENPNTTQAFPAQMITLISADYDFLLAVSPSGVSCIAPKGNYLQLCTTNSNYTGERRITYVSDTSLSVGNATYNGSTNNMYCIPSAIYGIKKNFQFKVNAIATDLSTRADHCFLSDDETSVEEALNNLAPKTWTQVYSSQTLQAYTRGNEVLINFYNQQSSSSGAIADCRAINCPNPRYNVEFLVRGPYLVTINSSSGAIRAYSADATQYAEGVYIFGSIYYLTN